jgi:outer membrane receptor protein involved in Fe transport
MLTVALLLLLSTAQPPARVTGIVRVSGIVEDASGRRVADAAVRVEQSGVRTRSAADGTFHIDVPERAGVTLVISAPGFLDRVVRVDPAAATPLRVVLDVAGISEVLVVSPHRGQGHRVMTPASVTVLDGAAVASSAPLALDDLLRGVPGFSLFRRSSSRVANPTTQGVTLRGMAASGASRTTVQVDDAPLTDAFGGWIQWSRVPSAAIARVDVARGGASDLYGGDAVGGAITMETARAGGRLFLDGGSHGTARLSGFGGHRIGTAGVRAGVERFTTDGYVIVDPVAAGPVDVPATSRHTSLYGGVDMAGARVSTDVRGGYVSESRGNGTPFQSNATTTWHGAGRIGGRVGRGALTARVHGQATDYEQTFSAVLAGRAAERPTSAQAVASSAAGGSLDWIQPLAQGTVLVSASGREARAELVDQPLSTPAPVLPTVVEARQTTAAISAQLTLPVSARVTLAGGLRAERWSSGRDGASRDTAVNAGPRASLVYQHTPSLSLRASLQSGYRFPTINELYRDFRVGNALTQANPDLEPEKSLGVEGSALWRRGRVTWRGAAFLTHLTGGIVNVTLQTGPALILRQRQNAASIRARGLEVEADVRLNQFASLTASSAFIDSTFRRGAGLDGLRVPQVPRVQAAAGAILSWARASAAVEWRFTSAQYDDDRNQFLLERAGTVNARAGWRPRRGLELFVAVENALDVEQDVGRTPIRTIGMPRSARAGLRLLR